eukprot:11411695-Alexandrium_andersonii.AAC.1
MAVGNLKKSHGRAVTKFTLGLGSERRASAGLRSELKHVGIGLGVWNSALWILVDFGASRLPHHPHIGNSVVEDAGQAT